MGRGEIFLNTISLLTKGHGVEVLNLTDKLDIFEENSKHRVIVRLQHGIPGILHEVRKHLKKDEVVYIELSLDVNINRETNDLCISCLSIRQCGYGFGIRKDRTNKPEPAIKKIDKVLKYVSLFGYNLVRYRTNVIKKGASNGFCKESSL